METNLRFQGQYTDEETGLFYNLNRYYDPGLGRYLTADPIKLAGGLNPYIYVDGNPVNWVDPLGLKGMPGSETKPTGDRSPEPTNGSQRHRVTKGADVTPEIIQDALKGDSMKTVQGEVSLPIVQRYVDKLLNGEVPPLIKVDGDVIVEGNHRYVAGKIVGLIPESTPGVVSPSRIPLIKLMSNTKIDPIDWSNH